MSGVRGWRSVLPGADTGATRVAHFGRCTTGGAVGVQPTVYLSSATRLGGRVLAGYAPQGTCCTTARLAGYILPSAAGSRELVWEGDFASSHSYAHVNREIVLALLKAGVSVCLVPRAERAEGGHAPALTWGRYGRIRELLRASAQAHASREDVHVRHVWPPDFGRPRACAKFVLIQPWEYGYLPSAWVGPVRANVDEVWAYSRFVRDTYVRSGVPAAKVAVVHPGVDPFVFSADVRPATIPSTKGYKFLFVGGAATSRKGVDVLLRAYVQAFRRSDDVSLVVKDYLYGPVGREIATVQADPDAPEVVYLYEDVSPWVMPGYYAAGDCLVLPYRAEGFGLPVLEAMACAKPVITTGYGATLDFCDASVAYLIPAREVPFPEARVGDFATCGTPVWAEPDETQLAALLRHVFTHREEGKEKGRRARERVVAGFTWEHAACQVIQRLGILHS